MSVPIVLKRNASKKVYFLIYEKIHQHYNHTIKQRLSTQKGGSMIDLGIPRIPLEMKNDMNRLYADPVLPEGYSFITYRDGLEKEWARIMCSVGFFPSEQDAVDNFRDDFLRCPEEAAKRVFFLQAPDGNLIASCSAWFEASFEKMHWLALLPQCQKQGLGQALVEKILYTFQQSGSGPIYLDTQTTSHRAICLYLKEGFYPLTHHHRTGEPDASFPETLSLLGTVMKEEYYEQFCRLARPR